MSVRWIALTLAAMSMLLSASRPLAQEPVPLGQQFQVNTYTTDSQLDPVVAVDGAGNFLVVWTSEGSGGSDTSGFGIQGRRYDSAGLPQGGQFQVNTYTTGSQGSPAVATDGAGNFLVLWASPGGAGSDTSGGSVQGQRYDSFATPQGGEFQVNTYTTGNQDAPAVATDGAGNFVAVWRSTDSGGSDTADESIQGRRYDSAGLPQGGQFQVNTYTTGRQISPAVTAGGPGNFVVVWMSAGSAESDTSDYSIHGQRYDSAGTAQGGEFQVNTYTTSAQRYPAVAADGAGNFVVVWQGEGSAGSDTSQRSIHARRYDGAGTPQGGEFQVNTYTTSAQEYPAVVFDGAGNFAIVWESFGSAGSDTHNGSIQAQRYDGAGTPQGGEFQVNTYTTGFQQVPAVGADAAGNLVVVWQSPTSVSIEGQRFAVPTTSSTSTSTSSTTSTLPTTDLLPGRIAIVKRGTLVKFVAKPIDGDTFTLPTSDPAAAGGSLRVFDLGTTAGADTYPLPAGSGWKGLGKPAGSKGYKYTGAGTQGDPCEVVLLKPSVIKGVCRGTGITLTPPFTGEVGVALSLGTTDRYCAQFGGKSVKNDAKLTKRKKAPAPGTCPP